jgi:hypothetical protein
LLNLLLIFDRLNSRDWTPGRNVRAEFAVATETKLTEKRLFKLCFDLSLIMLPGLERFDRNVYKLQIIIGQTKLAFFCNLFVTSYTDTGEIVLVGEFLTA